jgi:hypothetical protein
VIILMAFYSDNTLGRKKGSVLEASRLRSTSMVHVRGDIVCGDFGRSIRWVWSGRPVFSRRLRSVGGKRGGGGAVAEVVAGGLWLKDGS